ncbi:hypothetical protein SAMN05443144_105228 [Fodinibius roseus]|uniref:Uncharacterized protein n=1 Tax=Fodinibius roseus TaxID=1194090 RepID=A0A1M4Z2Q3_9BACT|nr:hypothetical protein [Fodinibius roseus]SHF12228.1 hypothetical protein SAMN05443144_105228 [Fodinibius roseus]
MTAPPAIQGMIVYLFVDEYDAATGRLAEISMEDADDFWARKFMVKVTS